MLVEKRRDYFLCNLDNRNMSFMISKYISMVLIKNLISSLTGMRWPSLTIRELYVLWGKNFVPTNGGYLKVFKNICQVFPCPIIAIIIIIIIIN